MFSNRNNNNNNNNNNKIKTKTKTKKQNKKKQQKNKKKKAKTVPSRWNASRGCNLGTRRLRVRLGEQLVMLLLDVEKNVQEQ
jgi:hypothetical protein